MGDVKVSGVEADVSATFQEEWQGLKRSTATVTGPHGVSEPQEWEKSDQPSQDELWILGDSDGHEVEVVVWLGEALEPSGVKPLLEELSHRGGSEGSGTIFSAFCSAVR